MTRPVVCPGLPLCRPGVLASAAAEGFRERYARGRTPQTVHVWWARRPHATMRALVRETLSSLEALSSLDTLSSLDQGAERSLPQTARVLDPFAGGGTIPFEAGMLGAEVTALDSNPMSCRLQQSLLGWPEHYRIDELLSQLSLSGQRVLAAVTRRSEELFPERERAVFGYYHGWVQRCATCGQELHMTRRPWLARRRGKSVALSLGAAEGEISLGDAAGGPWPFDGRSLRCPNACEHVGSVDLATAESRLLAVARLGQGGKSYELPGRFALPSSRTLERVEADLVAVGEPGLPELEIPALSGVINPAMHGLRLHRELFTKRQALVLRLLISELRREHETLARTEGEQRALCVTSLLSGCIDQLVDWNCRLSMWIPQNEQVGRAFCGPGVAMVWNHMETDPFLRGPANLHGKLERILRGVESLRGLSRPVRVRQGDARRLPFADAGFDAVITDPPYYDNLYYTELAEFFYVWKRMLFEDLVPEEFSPPAIERSVELVASSFRAGSREAAHETYARGMAEALSEAERVLRPGGLLCLVYGHSALLGWDALLHAFQATKLAMLAVHPLEIERKARPRGHRSQAVDTCFVFVAQRVSRADDQRRLPAQTSTAKGLSCFVEGLIPIVERGRGREPFDNVKDLECLEANVRQHDPEFRLSRRGSL